MLGGEPGAAPSAEETFVARSSLEAFDALAVDHRAVLLLVVVEGLPYQEAAHALDVPVGTVMSRPSRARAADRRLTGGEPGGARPGGNGAREAADGGKGVSVRCGLGGWRK